MVDPTLTSAVDDSISSSCRRLDGDDDDTSERNSFAPGVSHELFINSNQNWGATVMALIKMSIGVWTTMTIGEKSRLSTLLLVALLPLRIVSIF